MAPNTRFLTVPPFYMRVAAEGDPPQLAGLVRAALEESKTPFDIKPPAGAAAGVDFDTAKVDAAIGHKGKANGGVYQFGIPRADGIKQWGLRSGSIFSRAAAARRRSPEISSRYRANSIRSSALRDNGIEVTAIHNHMVGEEPRSFFVHFWANDDAIKLANGLGVALKTLNVARG
jgi:uncharacterized protein DUF1259